MQNSQTISLKKRNGESGFAIGLILLAVVLIAAIVAAIAAASRESGGTGDDAKAKLEASNINRNIAKIGDAITALKYDNASANVVHLTRIQQEANDACTGSAGVEGCERVIQVPLYDTARGGIEEPMVSRAAAIDDFMPTWGMLKAVTVRGVGTDTDAGAGAAQADMVIFLAGVTNEVCAAFNTEALGTRITNVNEFPILNSGAFQPRVSVGTDASYFNFGQAVLAVDTPLTEIFAGRPTEVPVGEVPTEEQRQFTVGAEFNAWGFKAFCGRPNGAVPVRMAADGTWRTMDGLNVVVAVVASK